MDNSHVSDLGLLQPIRGSLDDAWIRNAIQPFASYEIGCLVPGVYPAYARILHPAWSESGEPVAWGAGSVSGELGSWSVTLIGMDKWYVGDGFNVWARNVTEG